MSRVRAGRVATAAAFPSVAPPADRGADRHAGLPTARRHAEA
ncbi:hypothetical protein [Streptomyces hainanensis]|nr:hypothetical protein [Streptomyces hainanensis]